MTTTFCQVLLRGWKWSSTTEPRTSHDCYLKIDDDSEACFNTPPTREAMATADPPGLENIGNTCYMAASLQCLAATDILASALDHKNTACKTLGGDPQATHAKLVKTLAILLRLLSVEGDSHVQSPADVKNAAAALDDRFAGNDQEDAHEFVVALLAHLHEALNRATPNHQNALHGAVKSLEVTPDVRSRLIAQGCPEALVEECIAAASWQNVLARESSLVSDIFQGQIRTRTRCRECGRDQMRFEIFFDLSLSIQGAAGPRVCLQDALRDHFSLPQLVDWFCPRCRRSVKAGQTFRLWKLPPRLIIHLKRYVESSARKLDFNVSFPSVLDLSPWVVGSMQRESPIFNLYAAIEHSGRSINGGHYTAIARRSGSWFSFNDSQSHSCSPAIIAPSRVAILFFERHGDTHPRAQHCWHPQAWPHDPATSNWISAALNDADISCRE